MGTNPAIPKAKNAARGLIGVWALEEIRDRLTDGRTVEHPDFGRAPVGRLVYTESGHVSVNFMRAGRPRWREEDSPTDIERADSARGYGAYAGRYTVDEDEGFVLHHVEVALIPNRVGKDLKRFFSLSGDLLTLKPPVALHGGVEVQRSLLWRRL